MERLIIATRNRHKIRELADIVAPIGLSVVSLDEAAPGAPEVEETGETFLENAALKAISAWRHAGEPAVADDSGICVDALGGAPGVRSARYGGAGLDDPGRGRALAQAVREHTDRSAHYFCSLALVIPVFEGAAVDGVTIHREWPGLPQGTCLVAAEGRVDGQIIDEPAGDGGFGYDPWFYVPSLGRTFAEVPGETKHAISHRGKAFRALAGFLASLR